MSSGYLKRSVTRSDIMDDDIDDKDDTKRKSRNLSEKKRRDQFNMLINELSSMVSTTSRKMDKSTVLKSTISFLKNHNEIAVRSRAHEIQEDWKPSFLSNEEFTHLILEALDGFIIVFSENSGRILYVSEGVTSLLGHLPPDLLQQRSSLLDLVSDHDKPKLRRLLQNPPAAHSTIPTKREESDSNNYCQFLRAPSVKVSAFESREEGSQNDYSNTEDKENQVSFSCHIRRGDSNITGEVAYELVRLVGYFRSDIDTGDIEDDGSVSGKFSQYQSDGGDGKQVFVGTGRLQTPQLIREVSVVDLSKCEFTSRHSLEWKFLFLDHRAPPIIGYLPFEVLGTSGYDYYHVDDLDQVVNCHEKLMLKGEGTSCYYRFLTKGQQWIWLQTHFYITYHQWNSKPEFIVCTHRLVSYADVLKQMKKTSQSKCGEGKVGVRRQEGGEERIGRMKEESKDEEDEMDEGEEEVEEDEEEGSVSGMLEDGGRTDSNKGDDSNSRIGHSGREVNNVEEDTDPDGSHSLPMSSVWSYKTSSEQRIRRVKPVSRGLRNADSWEQLRGMGLDSTSVYSQVTSQTSSMQNRLQHNEPESISKCDVSGVENAVESRRLQEASEESVLCASVNSGEMLTLVTSVAASNPPITLSVPANSSISSTEHHHPQMLHNQVMHGSSNCQQVGGREKMQQQVTPQSSTQQAQYLTAIPAAAVLASLPLTPIYPHTVNTSTAFHPSTSVSSVEVYHQQPTHQHQSSHPQPSTPMLQMQGVHHANHLQPQQPSTPQFLVQQTLQHTSHQQQQQQQPQQQSAHHLVMTCAQSVMQERLQRKHAALQRLIVQQQEELRRVSEQLVMARYGLYPVEATEDAGGSNNAAAAGAHHMISSQDPQMHSLQVPYSPGGVAAGTVSSTTIGTGVGGNSPSATPHSPNPSTIQLFIPPAPSPRVLLDASRAATHQHSLAQQQQHMGSFGGMGMMHHPMAEQQQVPNRCGRLGRVGGEGQDEELITFQLSQHQAQLLFYSPSSPSSSTGTDAPMGQGVSSNMSSRAHLHPHLNLPSIPPQSPAAPTPSTNLACASSSPNSSTHRSQ
ncbi:circadian locomoter output cycles protein kaput [Ischnura elegans]|uniref:circadian locomoter output cycles protein kaput n=1 Tax=Ischnura elegans TaxID=197161 RepID=UPI001ED8AE2F|nr:circadian locomoter output cycles protein kaput [Ischnura elegans]